MAWPNDCNFLSSEHIKAFAGLIGDLASVHIYEADPGGAASGAVISSLLSSLEKSGEIFRSGWAAEHHNQVSRVPAAKDLENEQGLPTGLILFPQVDFSNTYKVLSAAREAGAKTIFVFDHWKNFVKLFHDPAGGVHMPDCIVFPDDTGLGLFKNAWEKGSGSHHLDHCRLTVLCHFAMEKLCWQVSSLRTEKVAEQEEKTMAGKAKTVLIALDPTTREEGVGYWYGSVLGRMLEWALEKSPEANFLIKPHPRQLADDLKDHVSLWRENGLNAGIVNGDIVELLADADEVWGVTSMALISALRLGIPALSFQGGRNEDGAALSNPHLESILADA